MNRADYLKLGSWNARCDRCGAKRKGDELRQTWDGLYVCPEHWEPRQPQDFVRAIRENPTPPFVRDPPDLILGICGPNGRTSVAGVSVAGCWVAGYTDPAFDPQVN